MRKFCANVTLRGYLRHVIFVTGGTGLVGSHLLVELCKNHDSITALKRPNSPTEHVAELFHFYNCMEAYAKIKWVGGDLLDPIGLCELVVGAEIVYHAAAMVSFDPKLRRQLISINADGTANLVNACLDASVSKMAYVSSTAAIGQGNEGELIDEEFQWKGEKGMSGYAVSKYRSELEIWRGQEEGLKVAMVNPALVIGPYGLNRSSASILHEAKRGMTAYPKGANAYVDARDIAKILTDLVDNNKWGERYLTLSENLSFKDFFELATKTFGAKEPSISVSRKLTVLLGYLEEFRCVVFGGTPRITRYSAASSSRITRFSNQKVKDAMDWEFISVEDALKNVQQYWEQFPSRS